MSTFLVYINEVIRSIKDSHYVVYHALVCFSSSTLHLESKRLKEMYLKLNGKNR